MVKLTDFAPMQKELNEVRARIADMEKNAGPDDSVMVNVARCRDARATLTDQQEG